MDALEAIEFLTPKPCPFPLIRIGTDCDGSYLLPRLLDGIRACFSPGTNNQAVFEHILHNVYGIKSHLLDYSSEMDKIKPSFDPSRQTFTKKWLSDSTQDDNVTMADWMNECEPHHASNADYILQMDIEGNEYRALSRCPNEILKSFRIIIIELHRLRQILLFGSEAKTDQELAFENLFSTHDCIHIHPNNTGEFFFVQDNPKNIPTCAEVTFLRKDFMVTHDTRNNDCCFYPSLPHPSDISSNTSKKPPAILNNSWSHSETPSIDSRIKYHQIWIEWLKAQDKEL